MFRSLPRSSRQGGVVKCSLVRDSLNTQLAFAPVLLRPRVGGGVGGWRGGGWGGGGEGQLGSAVSERGYVGFDFPLRALSRKERYYLL